MRLNSLINLDDTKIYIPYELRNLNSFSDNNAMFLTGNKEHKVGVVLALVMFKIINGTYLIEIEQGEFNEKDRLHFAIEDKFFSEKELDPNNPYNIEIIQNDVMVFNFIVRNLDAVELSRFKRFCISLLCNFNDDDSFLVLNEITSAYKKPSFFLPEWNSLKSVLSLSKNIDKVFFVSLLIKTILNKNLFSEVKELSIEKLLKQGYSYIDIYKSAPRDKVYYETLTGNVNGHDIYANYLPELKKYLISMIKNKDIKLDHNSEKYKKFVFDCERVLRNYFYFGYGYQELTPEKKDELINDIKEFNYLLIKNMMSLTVDVYMSLWNFMANSLQKIIEDINEYFGENIKLEIDEDLVPLVCYTSNNGQEDVVIVNKEMLINLSIMQDKRFYELDQTVLRKLIGDFYHHLEDDHQVYATAQYAMNIKNKIDMSLLELDSCINNDDKYSEIEEELYCCLNHEWGHVNIRESCIKDLQKLLESLKVKLEYKEIYEVFIDSDENEIYFAAFEIKAPINNKLLCHYVWKSIANNFSEIQHYINSKKEEQKLKMLEEIMQADLGDSLQEGKETIVKF